MPEEKSEMIEKAKIYKSPKNDYEAAVNDAAVILVKNNSALAFQRGIVEHYVYMYVLYI